MLDLDRLEEGPAIYVFARKWGKTYEALYVGQTTNLKKRISDHLLKNLQLMEHMKRARNGERVLIVGWPITKRGQTIARVLEILERALIRHFLLDGHDLANKQGKRIRRHNIKSDGKIPKAFVPSKMFVEAK